MSEKSGAGKAFDDLAGKLAQVSKKELDQRIRQLAKRKARKKRKK